MFDFSALLERLGLSRDPGQVRSLTTLLTPGPIRGRGALLRGLGVAAIAGVLGSAGIVAFLGAGLLVLATLVIWFVLSEVLGLDLEIDPAAFAAGFRPAAR